MNRSLWIAKSGMEGQQFKLDTISNNLANVATNGYKRGGVVFEDLMYDSLRQVGAASSDQTQLPTGLQVGLGARVSASTRNFSQGNLQQTGNNLDLAIKGQGFFQLQMPDGPTAYTRDGSFQLDPAGQIVIHLHHAGNHPYGGHQRSFGGRRRRLLRRAACQQPRQKHGSGAEKGNTLGHLGPGRAWCTATSSERARD